MGCAKTFSAGTFQACHQACQSCPNALNATRNGVALYALRRSLASQINRGRWLSPSRLLQVLPAGFPCERAASLAAGSCLVLLFFWLTGLTPDSRYITGTLYIAIDGPFPLLPDFMDLGDLFPGFFSILEVGSKRQYKKQ